MPSIYFDSARDFETWLKGHHASATELLVGFYKRAAGRAGITYPEALDLALAYGWIDGVRRGVDAERYTIRFTPRKPDSIWSAVNVKKVEALIAAGKMRPAGLKLYRARDAAKSSGYSYERQSAELDAAALRQFRANGAAWAFFAAQPPGYRRNASWWVISAKRDDTRAKRLATLIAESAAGKRLAMLSPGKKI